jgi:hypothetical protein
MTEKVIYKNRKVTFFYFFKHLIYFFVGYSFGIVEKN